MKNNMKKMAIFLATMLAMVACGGNNASSATNDKSSGSQPSETSNAGSGGDQTSQGGGNQSSQGGGDQSSQGGDSSSSGGGQEEPFKYDNYLLKHSGASAEYIFEAECTNLSTKEGLGYSGTATESGMASHDAEDNGFVTYLYKPGISLNFLIVCDRDINDGVLKARFGGEFLDVLLNPENYRFRVDTIVTDEDLEEAIGNWQDAFLDYYTDLSETGGYYINTWDCGQIHIDATGSSDVTGFAVFQITAQLSLKKGINCISLITNNADGNMGTMASIAPVVDYISITTSANLGMYDICDNGEGTDGVHFKA